MNIVVYSKDNCNYCSRAKALISAKGYTYQEMKIGEGGDIMKEDFVSLFPNVQTVPFIIVDGKEIGGYVALVEYFETKQELLTE